MGIEAASSSPNLALWLTPFLTFIGGGGIVALLTKWWDRHASLKDTLFKERREVYRDFLTTESATYKAIIKTFQDQTINSIANQRKSSYSYDFGPTNDFFGAYQRLLLVANPDVCLQAKKVFDGTYNFSVLQMKFFSALNERDSSVDLEAIRQMSDSEQQRKAFEEATRKLDAVKAAGEELDTFKKSFGPLYGRDRERLMRLMRSDLLSLTGEVGYELPDDFISNTPR